MPIYCGRCTCSVAVDYRQLGADCTVNPGRCSRGLRCPILHTLSRIGALKPLGTYLSFSILLWCFCGKWGITSEDSCQPPYFQERGRDRLRCWKWATNEQLSTEVKENYGNNKGSWEGVEKQRKSWKAPKKAKAEETISTLKILKCLLNILCLEDTNVSELLIDPFFIWEKIKAIWPFPPPAEWIISLRSPIPPRSRVLNFHQWEVLRTQYCHANWTAERQTVLRIATTKAETFMGHSM